MFDINTGLTKTSNYILLFWFYVRSVTLIYGTSTIGSQNTSLDHTSILFIKFQFYCGRFAALQNWGILYQKISVDLMLCSANLLYRYHKFVVPMYHYPRFKANPVQYFFEIELTYLKQICDNIFAMLIYSTNYIVSKYPQVINLLP